MFMRKFIFIIIIIFCFSCTSINYSIFKPTNHFYIESKYPQLVIDSLSKADSLFLGNYLDWEKIELFTSDSVIQKSYYIYNDSLKYSISVTEDINNKYSIKYIYE